MTTAPAHAAPARLAAVLRPEPGNSATADLLRARGVAVVQLPLFNIVASSWPSPPPASHDALLLTSANAVRLGGAELTKLRALPVLAVGKATARAAREHGFVVAITGEQDAAALVAKAQAGGFHRLLHLRGADSALATGGIITGSIDVYTSVAQAVAADALASVAGAVVLVHSPRAGQRFAQLVDQTMAVERRAVRLAAISPAAAAAAGAGWGRVATAALPNDSALIDAACTLLD